MRSLCSDMTLRTLLGDRRRRKDDGHKRFFFLRHRGPARPQSAYGESTFSLFHCVFMVFALDKTVIARASIGYGVGLRIKRSSVRIRPWPLRWVLGQGSLLPLSQGEAFTLASISYLAILVKYILAKKKKLFRSSWFFFNWKLDMSFSEANRMELDSTSSCSRKWDFFLGSFCEGQRFLTGGQWRSTGSWWPG